MPRDCADAWLIADYTDVIMWVNAAAFFLLALMAEVLGMGGIPAGAMKIQSIAFAVLLVTIIVTVLRKSGRR